MSHQNVQLAEAGKANMYAVKGNNELFHSVVVEEDYGILASHVDELTKRKIVNGEFVDFAKLIPNDRVSMETSRDCRLEIVSKNGQTFFQPVAERELSGITGIGKWDQAFRIFSAIYNEAHPLRAIELLQYNHTIHHAAQLFAWDNVNAYDVDFRMHLAKHPERSWGIILQQAWTMRLQDRIVKNNNGSAGQFNQHSNQGNFGRNGGGNSQTPKKKICWQYQVGDCEFGFGCRFGHYCGICGKYGHGAHICRKLKR